MREEKKAEKRQELVAACLDCFVEKGLTVATTKNLCKAAKLQNGGIYYYFSTKEEIVLACAEEAISRKYMCFRQTKGESGIVLLYSEEQGRLYVFEMVI